MIHLSCQTLNCGRVLMQSCVIKSDASSADLQCGKCKAVYRVTIILLHEGEKLSCDHKISDIYKDGHEVCGKCGVETKPITTPVKSIEVLDLQGSTIVAK